VISINTNGASTQAAYNLSNTRAALDRSIKRLSSGERITLAIDDPGGLAVSMKMSAAIRRTDAAGANVSNAQSFLQVQDGILKSADSVLKRMSELATLATDVTKTTGDLSLYQTEFTELANQVDAMTAEEFNGIALFATGGSTLTVRSSEDGTQTVSISQSDLDSIHGSVSVVDISSNTGAAAAISTITSAIESLADQRATNGSESTRLGYAVDLLAINKSNLDSANTRILDIDLAKESADFARWNILQQAGTAMLAQANQSQQSILRLMA
jgi:flagellin